VDTEAVQVFTSLLAIVTLIGAVASLVAWLLAPRSLLAARAATAVGDAGLWLAAAVAVGATVGSLYFSEVAGFAPCKLCWFQRIAMYPLAPILLVAALRRDRSVGWYVFPLAATGVAIAGYHALLEWRPSLDGGVCGAVGPSCTDVWFREFGFVTLAFMALVGFLSIIVFTLLAVRPRHRTESS
jgi:disulfide bond formation protein DsbB